jgi:hypothetical protein
MMNVLPFPSLASSAPHARLPTERSKGGEYAALLANLKQKEGVGDAKPRPLAAHARVNDLVSSTQSLVASGLRIPGALADADADGRLTPVDIDAFRSSGGTFRSPAQLAASLVETGARKFVFGENHFAPHPELVVATILEIARRTGQAPVVFHESYGGPFQDLVDDLRSGSLGERDFAESYIALVDHLSGGSGTEYARNLYVPQLLAYHQAGARIVLLDDLQLAENRDAAWEARYAADQASNPHEHSIFVVGGVHSQKSPSITDDDFPENDFQRPLGMRIAERYAPRETLNIYVANSPRDAMANVYGPAFDSWDAVLPMPRELLGRDRLRMALPADADGVPLLSPEAFGARWQAPATQMKSMPKNAEPADRDARKALNSNTHIN